MFQALFRHAEVAIEQSIGHLLARVAIAVPFLVAAGFGTAALWYRLDRELGPELANLALAGLFCGAGLVAAVVMALKFPATGHTATGQAAAADAERPPQGEQNKPISDADRELLYAALTTAAPLALPHLVRLVLRNLPLVIAAAGAIFVMTRPSTEQAPVPGE